MKKEWPNSEPKVLRGNHQGVSRQPEEPQEKREEDSEPLRERYVTPRFHLGKALLENGRVAILKYSDSKFGTVD